MMHVGNTRVNSFLFLKFDLPKNYHEVSFLELVEGNNCRTSPLFPVDFPSNQSVVRMKQP